MADYPDEASLTSCYLDHIDRFTVVTNEDRASALRAFNAIKAAAWDEGYDSRKRQAAQNPPMGVPGHVAPKNPYRTEGLNSEDKS